MKESTKEWAAVIGAMVVLLVFGAIIYIGTSSIRYGGPSDKEYDEIELAAKAQDAKKLNHILVNTRSPSTKLIVMYHLEKIKSPRSIPALLEMLSYDLPWWDKLDTELKPTPLEVRFSAYGVLKEYGDSIVPELKRLVESKTGYKQMYAAALLYKLGYTNYRGVLNRYMKLGGRFEEEIDLIARDLSLDKH